LAREKGYYNLERFLEEYERDFERFGKKIPLLIQDLSHQVAQLSSLEFDEGKRDELLDLPQTIQSMKEEMDKKVGEIVGEKDRLIEELRREKDEMKREMEEVDKQREESHQQMIQDLTEENKRITKEFREMRDLMNQDFKEKFEDQDVKITELGRDNKDLRNQLESLSSLINKKNEERSEEDVRREIDQIISEIFPFLQQLTRDQIMRFCKLQDELEDEEGKLSNEELLEMLDELNQMKLSI